MTTLQDLIDLGRKDSFLAIVSTVRANGTPQASLVNAGVLDHPFTGEPVVAFVTYGPVKLKNLRERPDVSVTFRAGWRWGGVDGRAELIGPDDPHPEVDAERLRMLLREVFIAAGGTHNNWDEYDAVMARERRVAVLIEPRRIYGN